MLFGNFIFNYIVGRSLAEGHPTKDFEHCINRRQVKHKCSICEDICPGRVYSGTGSRKADFVSCINCNLCVAACPTRCIASSATNVSSFLKLLKTPEEFFYIACEQYEGDVHLKVSHFAALSWEYLVCLGLQKRVVFLTVDVPEADEKAETVWHETLVCLKNFFGEEEFGRRFIFSDKVDYTADQEINRRELFQKVNTELRSKFSSFAPSEDMMDGLLYRYLLRGVLTGDNTYNSFGWIVPAVSSECKGCGVCEKLCPQAAITVKKDNGQFTVYLYPFRCNHCGLCQKTCIHHAIDGFGSIRINSLKPVILFDSKDEDNRP